MPVYFCQHGLTTGNNDGSSWENAFQNLFTSASALNDGDILLVKEHIGIDGSSGTITLTSKCDIYGGFASTLSGTSYNLANIKGKTLVNGGSANRRFILASNSFSLNNFEVYSYAITGGNGLCLRVITNTQLSIYVNNCVFHDFNATTDYNAVLAVDASLSSSLYINKCKFYNNSGRYVVAVSTGNISFEIKNSVFYNNTTYNGMILPYDSTKFYMSNCLCYSNLNTNSHGIVYGAATGHAYISNCTFINNTANTEIIVADYNCAIYNCLFYNNTFSSSQIKIAGLGCVQHCNIDTATVDALNCIITNCINVNPLLSASGYLTENSPENIKKGGYNQCFLFDKYDINNTLRGNFSAIGCHEYKCDRIVTVGADKQYTSLASAIAGEEDFKEWEKDIVFVVDAGVYTSPIEMQESLVYTTSASHRLIIRCADGAFHNFKRNAGVRISINAGWTQSLLCRKPYTEFYGLFFENTDANGRGVCVGNWSANDYGYVLKNCFFCGHTSTQTGFEGCVASASINPITIVNCLVCGFDIGLYIYYGANIYNTVVLNSLSMGLRMGYSTIYAKNCYIGGSGTSDIVNPDNRTLTVTTSYTEDGSLSTPVLSLSACGFVNTAAGQEDITITSGSGLVGLGTDLSNDATYPVKTDALGVTRKSTPCIGPLEVYPAGQAQDLLFKNTALQKMGQTMTGSIKDIIMERKIENIYDIPEVQMGSVINSGLIQ